MSKRPKEQQMQNLKNWIAEQSLESIEDIACLVFEYGENPTELADQFCREAECSSDVMEAFILGVIAATNTEE